jgi:hypothetical protein
MKTALETLASGAVSQSLPLPTATHPNAAISDGDCVRSGSHRLVIALNRESLQKHHHPGSGLDWVLPLEQSEVAVVASELQGDVFWISLRHPRVILGSLADDIRGAWIDGDAIVVNLDGNPIIRPLDSRERHEIGLSSLAGQVAAVWLELRGGSTRPPVLLPLISSENLVSEIA